MSPPTVGIVDYGIGNLSSVWHALRALEFRCRVSNNPRVLDAADILLLPGVGAFPVAMAALHQLGLVDYLRTQAAAGRPVVGICLGMQLLVNSSREFRITEGLGLIPGQALALNTDRWHIGWNAIETITRDPLFEPSHGKSFYFNHSYAVDVAPRYRICIARLGTPVTAVIRERNVVGVQFHPEKSQAAGRELLRNVVMGLRS